MCHSNWFIFQQLEEPLTAATIPIIYNIIFSSPLAEVVSVAVYSETFNINIIDNDIFYPYLLQRCIMKYGNNNIIKTAHTDLRQWE